MSPAAHAVVGAALCGRIPRLWIALPAAFFSHFVMDAIYHFEAFYPLSRWLDVERSEAFWIAAAVLGGSLTPPMLWIVRKERELFLFLGLVVGLCVTMRVSGWPLKTGLSLALVALFLAVTRSRRAGLWALGAAVAAAPDILKYVDRAVYSLHGAWHYSSARDAGYWINRLLGGPEVYVWERFDYPGYWVGYGLAAAAEATILLGSLWLLARSTETAAGAHRR